MGLFDKGFKRDDSDRVCIYCKKKCFRSTVQIRFDKATLLATCEKGKQFDRACEEMAEAEYYAKLKTGGWADKKDSGEEPGPNPYMPPWP